MIDKCQAISWGLLVTTFKTNYSIQKAKGFLTIKTATINLVVTKETNHRAISYRD